MIDTEIKKQLAQYLQLLESDIVFKASLDSSENSAKVREFLTEIVEMSERLSLEEASLERTPSFEINKPDEVSGVTFAGLPLGHEFTSFILALLQVSGRAPKVDDSIIKRIKNIKENLKFVTYVSLTCHNCPDVVQALNIMSVTNPNISHTMVEGGMFQDEVDANGIMAVPTVFLNGEEFAGGRMSIEELVDKVAGFDTEEFANKETFDTLVIGGGPAGASAAIYSARKGIKTGIVAEKFGGQVVETVGIENMIGTIYTEGPQLMSSVEAHVNEYEVDIMKGQKVTDVKKEDDLIKVELESGATLETKSLIISTGAHWRNMNVPGEEEFRNKGVTYCPHCDGPFYAGKNVAVIGGGNSGAEAAIDLSGIAKHVYILEFAPEMRADQVLQDRIANTDNISVTLNAATKVIKGNDAVESIVYVDRDTNEEHEIALEGIFVQIGLLPNTAWLKNTAVELNERGEVIVDKHGQTNVPGIFAAGDCTDSAYKQIIISMGSGATAALGAFDYQIRQ
ncbi:alkyl hydroperoxide reductase subunit F [Floricoccus penangensis]|uniref:alkyl hydroperoxide reductase subunit F n=1 Tax=Floricoccus penangensis TaxID=1859475 RepID=UPI00203ACC88|nr:alkyl hydroperoxide reductase subunit F [Floricoccus penangensis]URZ87834.1 alkyl hydroperoxide reductase subunit F [Floricoccus penangensis]